MFSAGSTSRHFSSSTNCPLQCRGAYLPLRPDACELFAAGASGDTPAGSLVMSVRAKEMLGSIKDALRPLAQQGDAYKLSKNNNTEQIPLTHVRTTLKRY